MTYGEVKMIERQKISELAMELYKKAVVEEKNEDIYSAGLRESETFMAFMDIFNYYRSFYRDNEYFFNLLIMKMHKREDDELYKEVMEYVKRS